MISANSKILIVAGEASGDLHAANLIHEMNAHAQGLEFYGIGGSRMADAGCDIIVPMEQVSAMGFVEVVRHFGPIWSAFQVIKRELFSVSPPDLLITIDFQEFNQKLAARAQKAGVKVLHYVSPQVWAWRPGRVRKMARLFNKMAAIFPFEPEYYEGQNLDVRYVGHPLLDDLKPPEPRPSYLKHLAISEETPVVGLFPGSRRSEVENNLPTLVEAARILCKNNPRLHLLVPVAPSIERHYVASFFEDVPQAHLVEDEIYTVAHACDAIMAVSGTVTLQIALTQTPMAIIYKMPALTYAIAKRVVNTPYIGLPNIVAGKKVVPELIQDDATPNAIVDEIERQLLDAEYRSTMLQGLDAIKDRMGKGGSSKRVAQMAFDLLKEAEKSS